MRRCLLLTLLSVVLLLAGCDRGFSDVGKAEIEVVSPDVREATTESEITLEVKVTSVREVTKVSIGQIELVKTGALDTWRAVVPIVPGLNRLVVESIVDDGPISSDTVDVLRINWSFESKTTQRPIRFTTGGHSATLLDDGALLLIGGATQPGSGGTFDGWILEPGAVQFSPVRSQTIAPRVGHTASLLPDGRVLLVGGGTLGDVGSVQDLVDIVEVYDPVDQSFTQIPVVGEPIRRMYHSTIVRNLEGQTFLVLLGGRGDTQYVPQSVLDIREDMRTFQLAQDTLYALSPAVGPFIEPVAGHTMTPLDGGNPFFANRFLIEGIKFDSELSGTALTMDFASPVGIDVQESIAMMTPRLRHASVLVDDGIVVHFGGRGENISDVYNDGEIWIDQARKHFRLPTDLTDRMTAAFGHSATIMADRSIALIGGFDEEGTSLSTVEFVSLSFY